MKNRIRRYAWVLLVFGSLFAHREIEIIEITVAWATKYIAMSALLWWDERRLPHEKLARAWPPATRLLACAVFQEMALPIHFGRTRRSIWGVLLGFFWAAMVVGLGTLAIALTLVLV